MVSFVSWAFTFQLGKEKYFKKMLSLIVYQKVYTKE